MPASSHPVKRNRPTFTKVIDIRRSLASQEETNLIAALTTLRNQLTVKYDEPSVSPGDERLQLVQEWLEKSPGAQDVFSLWERIEPRQLQLLTLLVSTLSTIITLLSTHYTYQVLAQPIIKSLVSAQWAHRLAMYLRGSHTELLLVTLKLYNSLVDFAGGRERKTVFEVFPWETKTLPKLLNMRRKGKIENINPVTRPDIRTLFVLFLFAFVDNSTPSAVKITFLEQRRDLISVVFKGLWQDHYVIIRRVLEVCWTGLWSDAKVARTLKISLFSEAVLTQLLRLYERNTTEDEDPEHLVADVAHHFLLAICTRPGTGVCFKDKGWYPRESETEEVLTDGNVRANHNEALLKAGKIHNKILANFIRNLKVNEDPRQQELALKILTACPELIAGYWATGGLALEPRLSSKWIANISFFGAVVLLPVPQYSFLMNDGSNRLLYKPSPPPLSSIMANILPSPAMKNHFSRGLQSTSGLVQHCSALALAKSLMKYETVIRAFDTVQYSLEEDEHGQWLRMRHDVEREMRKRVPDFQVILGFSQKVDATSAEGPDNVTKTTLLSESAQRLLWLYQRSLPSLVFEARFDIGKLLSAFQGASSDHQDKSSITGLVILRQLHAIRMLTESDQFNWAGKAGQGHSNFYTLMKTYTQTDRQAIKDVIVSLLHKSLSTSLLFQHDPSEISFWMISLPSVSRSPNATAPDGTPLTEEGDSVVSFVDDCAQRCFKTPYRYLEDLKSLLTKLDGGLNTYETQDGQMGYPSPLLITVLEQLKAKLNGKRLSPSDALAVMTYVRKLIVKLASKIPRLDILLGVVAELESFIAPCNVFHSHPSISFAITEELTHIQVSLQHLQHPEKKLSQKGSIAVQQLLVQVEETPIPSTEAERKKFACELVDWFRLINKPLLTSEVGRLLEMVAQLHKSAFEELLLCLRPDLYPLWECIDVKLCYEKFRQQFEFGLLFLHCNNDSMQNVEARRILVDSLVANRLSEAQKAVTLVHHRLSHSLDDETVTRSLLELLAGISETVRSSLSQDDFALFSQSLLQSASLKQLCNRVLSSTVRQGLGMLLRVVCASPAETWYPLVSEYTSYWSNMVRDAMNQHGNLLETTKLWMPYMTHDEILAILDDVIADTEASTSRYDSTFVEEILQGLARKVSSSPWTLTTRVKGLLKLRPHLPSSTWLEALLADILRGNLPMCLNGFAPPTSSDLEDIVSDSRDRWFQRGNQSYLNIDLEDFLKSGQWSDAQVEVIAALLYLQSPAGPVVCAWLKTDSAAACTTAQLARVIHALLDSNIFSDDQDTSFFVQYFERIIKALATGKIAQGRSQANTVLVECARLMVDSLPAIRPRLLSLLAKACGKFTAQNIPLQALQLVAQLSRSFGGDVNESIGLIVEKGLAWAVRHFSSDDVVSEDDLEFVTVLSRLIVCSSSVKAHLAEPVIATIIQNHLSEARALHMLRALLKACPLKPVSVNKHLQSIVQHPRLYELCSTSHAASREGIIDALHTLFHLYPPNTCQPTHIEPLLRLYEGSLELSDWRILSIFQLFEATKKASAASPISHWSSLSSVYSSTALEAILSLDTSRVFKTCLMFPSYRSLGSSPVVQELNPTIYDPVFIVLLFAQTMTDAPPSSALTWVQLFRTNICSLLIRAMSSKDDQLRKIAVGQVAALYRCVQDADMQEKPHVLYILDLLKNTLVSESLNSWNAPVPPRLPAYSTLLLAHALRAVFYPANFVYPLLARFLLQRPVVDIGDVPLLFGMLYSSGDGWKKERGWIVRFLSDGMVGSEEWRVLRRRHTWDLVASLFQSEESDRALRRGILELLVNITCHAHATTTLVLKSHILPWIEMQLRDIQNSEDIAWIKLLENILVMMDPARVEAATNGEWRSALGRCILRILKSPVCTPDSFRLAVPVILRLCLLPGRTVSSVPAIMERSLAWLHESEKTAKSLLRTTVKESDSVHAKGMLPPHGAQHLFEVPIAQSWQDWGTCVEMLWRATMAQGVRSAEWDALTTRLLVWRGIVGHGETRVGEWARKTVVENLKMSH